MFEQKLNELFDNTKPIKVEYNTQYFNLPTIFSTSENVMLTIVDGSGCEKFEILSGHA